MQTHYYLIIKNMKTKNELENEIKNLKTKLSLAISDVQFVTTALTIIKDELGATKYRAETLLSGPIEDNAEFFYTGQITLINRLEDIINNHIN